MRPITIYESFDGSRFKTEDECLDYENYLKNKSGLVLESVTAYIKKHPYLEDGSKAGKLRAIEWIKGSFRNSFYGYYESKSSESSEPSFQEEAENVMSVLMLCSLVGNYLTEENAGDTASIYAYIREKTSIKTDCWSGINIEIDCLVQLIFGED